MSNKTQPAGQKHLNDTRYNQGRYTLLFTIIMSAVNIFSIIFAETYFLYSTYMSQFIMSVAYWLFHDTGLTYYIIVGAILSVISIIPYLLCYIFSKKRIGWMIAAVAMFSIDTIWVLIDFNLEMIGNIIIHAIILIVLIGALIAGFKAKKAVNQQDNIQISSDGTIHTEDNADSSLVDESQSFNGNFEWNEYSDIQRTITINRKKSFYGCGVLSTICLNGEPVGAVKNKQSTTIKIDGNSYKLTTVAPGGGGSNEVIIPAGEASKEYDIAPKFCMASLLYGLSMNITEKK